MSNAKLVTTKHGTRKQSKGLYETATPQLDLTLTYLDPSSLEDGFQESKNQIQSKREDTNARRIKHDQRRRKYIRQLDTAQINHSRGFFEKEVVGRLLAKATCEKEEDSLKKEVLAYKDIITANRRNRERRMEELAVAQSAHDLAWEAVEAKREFQWTSFLESNSQVRRREVLNGAKKYAQQNDIRGTVRDFLGKVLDAVDWAVTYRAMTGMSDPRSEVTEGAEDSPNHPSHEYVVVPDLVWRDVRAMIVNDGPFMAPLPHLVPSLPSTLLLPFSISERTLFADAQWLTSQAFTGSYVFDRPSALPTDVVEKADDDSVTGQATKDDNHGVVKVIEGGNAQHHNGIKTPRSCSALLAQEDWSQLVESTLLKAAETFTATPATVPHAQQQEHQQDPSAHPHKKLLTPAWLYDTPSDRLLSEAIIALRCAEHPLPEEPTPRVDTRHLALRLALLGDSQDERLEMVRALTTLIPRIKVIAVADLLTQLLAQEAAGTGDKAQDLSADQSQDTAVEEKNIEEVRREVLQALRTGQVVSDALYVALVVYEITSIPRINNGFVLVDFPRTRPQCLLLLEALSGIRFDSARPQPSDYLSRYAALSTDQHWQYSIERAGFDLLLCTDVSSVPPPLATAEGESNQETNKNADDDFFFNAILPQHVQRRRDLQIQPAQSSAYVRDPQRVQLSAQTISVRHWQQQPSIATQSPSATIGVSLTAAHDALVPLQDLARYLQADDHVLPRQSAASSSSSSSQPSSSAAKNVSDQAPAHESETEEVGGSLPAEEGDVQGSIQGGTETVVTLLEDEELPVDVRSDPVKSSLWSKALSLRAQYIPDRARWHMDFWLQSDIDVAVEALAAQALEPAVAAAVEGVFEEELVVQAVDEEVAKEVARQAQAEEEQAQDPALSAPAPAATTNVVEEPEDAPAAIEKAVVKGVHVPELTAQEHTMSRDLATVLNRLWTLSETQSTHNGTETFSALRDIRCLVLQRARLVLDTVCALLAKDDQRQELLDNFRVQFNALPADLRFDPDCLQELHLRTLLLQDRLVALSETKSGSATQLAQKLGSDGCLGLWVFGVQAEIALLLQSELSRFYVALDVLFDGAKALQGFATHVRFTNELEPLLPSSADEDLGNSSSNAANAKGGAKGGAAAKGGGAGGKGKDANNKPAGMQGSMSLFVPYREGVAPLVVPSQRILQRLPETVDIAAPVAAASGADEGKKGKGKEAAKPKKGAAEDTSSTPYDPVAEVLTAIQEEVVKWQEGRFSVSRDLFYGGDEALCQAVERAVWYEAHKLQTSTSLLQSLLSDHLQYLTTSESILFHLVQRLVRDRFDREMHAIQQVLQEIHLAIREALPLPNQLWLVTSDAHYVVAPDTVWQRFRHLLGGSKDAGTTTAGTKGTATGDEDVMTEEERVTYESGAALAHQAVRAEVALQRLRSSSMRMSFSSANSNSNLNSNMRHGSFRGNTSPRAVPQRARSFLHTGSSRGGGVEGFYRHKNMSNAEESRALVLADMQDVFSNDGGDNTQAQQEQHAILLARYEERYRQECRVLQERLQQERAQRVLDYEAMGLAPATAILAAGNELILQEQQAQADLDARFASYLENRDAKEHVVEVRTGARH